jgi:hypothetical protein
VQSHLSIWRSLILAGCFCGLTFAQQTGVIVRFDPSTPSVGPFPTDYLTIPDSTQKTGLTIQLPMPDCTKQPSECHRSNVAQPTATTTAYAKPNDFFDQHRMVTRMGRTPIIRRPWLPLLLPKPDL